MNHTDNCESRASAFEANGTPLSVGQAVGLKKPFEMSETLLQGDRRVPIAPQQVAGSQIADRQRETVVPVLQAELVGIPLVPAPQVRKMSLGPWGMLLGHPRCARR